MSQVRSFATICDNDYKRGPFSIQIGGKSMRMTVLYHMFLESGLDFAPKDEPLLGRYIHRQVLNMSWDIVTAASPTQPGLKDLKGSGSQRGEILHPCRYLGKRLRKKLNVLQCTGQSVTTKNYLA